MTQIEWNNDLSIGIELVDEQHKMLIQRLNDLSKAVEMHHGEAEIMKTLQFLIDYTTFHFTAEEEHMKKQDYPGLEYQQRQHEEFKKTLNNIVQDFEEDGSTQAIATSINTFLTNWLINHIKGVDLKFGEFLKDQGELLP